MNADPKAGVLLETNARFLQEIGTKFRVCQQGKDGVKAEGLEPSTHGLKVRCSTD